MDWPIHEIVEVEWGDAHSIPGWLSPHDEPRAMTPLKTRSVGYLFKRTKDVLVLVETQNDGQIGGVHTIPTAMITAVRWIRK